MENIVLKQELTISTNLLIMLISFLFVFSCTNSKKNISTSSNIVTGIGYIVSTEQMNNRFFDNGVFYFIPAQKIDSIFPMKDFQESNFSVSYAFVLYSSYYIRLINSMSYDLKVYELDLKKCDPVRLNIEFRRVLPVQITFTYDTTNLKKDIQMDSILVDKKQKMHFKYRMVNNIKIQDLKILMPKNDDLTGQEALYDKMRYVLVDHAK
jgi:hypothetical protein